MTITKGLNAQDDTQSLNSKETENGLETTLTQQYKYDPSKTSVITDIEPSRVGTGGGVIITLTVTGKSYFLMVIFVKQLHNFIY